MQQNSPFLSSKIDRPLPIPVDPSLTLGYVHGVDHRDDSCVWLVVTTSEDAWRQTLGRQIRCGLVTTLGLLSYPLVEPCVLCVVSHL